VKIDGVTISEGNTKLGTIPNLSMPPLVTCKPGVKCAKDCYARKSWKQYPNVREAWLGNYWAYRTDPRTFFGAVEAYLRLKQPRRFRIHVAGDFFEQEYVNRWAELIKAVPYVHFLAFTKAWHLDLRPLYQGPRDETTLAFAEVPNLALVYSRWPGDNAPWDTWHYQAHKQAWMKDPANPDPRIPTNARPCAGNCTECTLCWDLDAGCNVVFEKH
jgi:hypothetical protein